MKIFKIRSALNIYLDSKRSQGAMIGFVPTMGALHKGHVSLVAKSAIENGITVVSVFVNPRQFNDKSDFEKYPRNIDDDIAKLKEAGCNVLFLPEYDDIFLNELPVKINFDGLDEKLEGAFRPGHFQGVVDIVNALFEAIKPSRAYFGLKDFQQLLVVKKLASQRHPLVEIKECEIVRESDGLAMSSRNARLDLHSRAVACSIFGVLMQSKTLAIQGARVEEVLQSATKQLELIPEFKLEYASVCNPENLNPAQESAPAEGCILLVAVWCVGVRLIDNIYLNE